MWWHSTCIVGPLNRCLPMKTRSKTPTAGVLMRPPDKKRGRLSRNGSGTRLLELGHLLEPTPMRTTEFAPAVSEAQEQQPPSSGYSKPSVAAPWKAGRFSGQDFALQSDGTLRCPANQPLVAHERRKEADGSLRVVYAASIRSCRPCPLRDQCQWNGSATAKPSLRERAPASARRRFGALASFETGAVGTTDVRASSCCAI